MMENSVVFFPGKNTPLKRYRSYFPHLILDRPKEGENPDVVLCHSRGLDHAIQYCENATP